MQRLKMFVVFIVTITALLFAGGCNPSGKSNGVEREQFQAVEKYVYEIVPAVEDAKYDIDQWSQDTTDLQTREWLECDAETITGINDSHLGAGFPDYASMKEWSAVTVTRGDEEWAIEGRELASLVEKIISSTGELTIHLQALSRNGEKVTEKEKRQIGEAIEESYQAALQLRYMFGFEY